MDLIEAVTPGNTPEFTVSEISGAVKRVIEGEFGRVRVRGEIGRVSCPRSGHCYLDLKDERAVLAAVIWKPTFRALPVPPEEGMEVVATGRLTTFPGSSKYQMVIEEIAPAGIGALMAMLEKRRAALAAEGLFDAGAKRPLPFLPEVIGVVTSPSGAVIRDILHRLRERFPRRVLLWPVAVQGPNCAAEVAAAIRGFNALAPGGPVPRPDLLIVARGGGSIEDLWGFNEEIVVRAAAASAIPLISAVGHETDTTLIDHAADRRAPTPSAAAEMAVPVRLDLLAATARLEERRRGALARGLALRGQRLRDLARGLPRPEGLLAERAQRLDACALRLPGALERLAQRKRLAIAHGPAGRFGTDLLARAIERNTARVASCAERLRPAAMLGALRPRAERVAGIGARLPGALAGAAARKRIALGQERAGRFGRGLLARVLDQHRGRVASCGERLHPERRAERIRHAAERLEARAVRLGRLGPLIAREPSLRLTGLGRMLDSLDYHRILKRGFAVVRDGAGAVVTEAGSAAQAAALELEFCDGRVRTRPERPARRPAQRPAGQGTLF